MAIKIFNAIFALGLVISMATACRPLWDNMCNTHSECCSGNCARGNPNWATGVCRPAEGNPNPNPGNGGGGSGSSVSQQEFNNAVTGNNYPHPSGEKYSGFINGLSRGQIKTKLEAAMALAQFLHESGGLVYKREIVCDNGNNCPNNYRTPGCDAHNQYYFGRGYIQLSWCGNYRAAGQDLGIGDALVQDPDRVAREEQMSWNTAFSYWKRQVHNFPGVQQGRFGASTRAINGQQEECQGNGKNANKSRQRFQIYKVVFRAFGLSGSPDENGCNY